MDLTCELLVDGTFRLPDPGCDLVRFDYGDDLGSCCNEHPLCRWLRHSSRARVSCDENAIRHNG